VSEDKTILIGYSGHGYVVLDVAIEQGIDILGYSEKNELFENPFNLTYLGFENKDEFIGWNSDIDFILGIGDNKIRQNIAKNIQQKNKRIKTLIHASASISKTAEIGEGTFVNRNVSINALSKIGEIVILNTSCVIEHDCTVGNAAHIAPGAVLAGNVSVGERTFIGANSVVKQGIKIGKDVIIGAGSVVLKNIPDGETWIGNPAKKIK